MVEGTVDHGCRPTHRGRKGDTTVPRGRRVGAAPPRPPGNGKPVAISSANGLKAVEKAVELMNAGADPLDAAVAGVAIVEADPTDHTVGLGLFTPKSFVFIAGLARGFQRLRLLLGAVRKPHQDRRR